jgi:hypothetical protein
VAAPHFPRGRLLPKQIAALLLLGSPGAMAATTWTVNTCGDDVNIGDTGTHTGSLRFVAAWAVGGDEIDLSHLACSTITLYHGAIPLPQNDITLHGPGTNGLTISGNESDRVFRHTGFGWLKINDLSVKYGYLRPAASSGKGGCIRSYGNVSLDHVLVSGCKAYKANYSTAGGGIFTTGSLWLLNSSVSGNAASTDNDSPLILGGGAYAEGDLFVVNSTISGNAAHARAAAGGLYALGNASVYYSTISDNHADANGGALRVHGTTIIANSTISGNSAPHNGGVKAFGSITILNSTIAFNDNGGLVVLPYQPLVLSLHNSLIANNGAYDISRCCESAQSPITLDGSNNIVLNPKGIDFPPDIATTGVCPLLGPLRDNGGPTKTHALLSKSPGIDQGDAGSALYDQRGFWRVSGLSADIGAYEIDQSDVIFDVGFDGCP